MKRLLGICIATGILLTLFSQILLAQVQLIPTKSDFGGGYNISCIGVSDGSISLAVIGADSLTLTLYKGETKLDSNFVNSLPKVWNSLSFGSYRIYGYLNDSLVAGDTLVLYQPSSLGLASSEIVKQSCNPGGDGSVSFDIQGGVNPYRYSWTGRSDTTSIIDSLIAGNYSVTVTDANECSFNHSFTVGTANAPQVTLHVTGLNQWGYHVNCAEDETANVWVSFSENASNLDINWDITKKVTSVEKGEFSVDTIVNTSHVFIANLDSLNDVGAGLYRVTITNASGCSVTDSIEVLAPIVFFSEHKAACNSNWYPGSQQWGMKFWENLYGGITPYHAYGTGSSLQDTLYVYSGTTYFLDVHDAAGCRTSSISGPFQIGETTLAGMLQSMCNLSFGSHVPVQLVLTKQDYEGGANVSCYGAEDGSISTAVIGADTLTIVLKKNGLVVDSSLVNSFPKVWSELGAGNYKVFAYRGSIPVTSDSIKLFNPQLLHLKSSTLVKESCSPGGDGSIFIDISGGVQPYSYQWNGRSDTIATIDSLQAGSYTYSVTDANGCETNSTIALGNTGIPTISVNSTSINQWGYHLDCWNDESVNVWATVGGTGNLEVNWRVKEIEGTIQDDFFGMVDSSLSTNTYYVSNMDTLKGVTSGWYIATVGNGSGCTVKDSIEIKAPYKLGSQLKINCNPAYTLGCNCYAIELDIKPVGGIPPYTVLGHSNVSQDSLLVFADQTHFLTLSDAAGCKTSFEGGDTLTINLNDEAIHGICGLDMSGQLTLIAGNKSVYPGGYNVSRHGASDGEISFMHYAGCMEDHQLYIKKLPNGNLDSLTNASASGLSAGNYKAYVHSCGGTQVDSISFQITEPQELSSAISVSYSSNCNGLVNATLFAQVSGGVAGYTYQWTQSIEGGQPTEIGEGYNMLTISSFGAYFLRAIDANGDTTQAQIEITPAAQLSIQANAVAKYGEYHTRCDVGDGEIAVHLTGGISPYYIHINGNINMGGRTSGFSRDTTVNDTSFTLHGFSAGNVGISVQDAGGCNANLSQYINLNKPGTPQVFVTGEVKPNGYYFSCDTCTDANMSVTLGDINEPVTYKWYELPSEYASSIKLDGASLIQVDQEGEIFTGEGLTPYFTGLNNTQIIPGVLNKFVAIDALGCVTSSNVILEKPKPFTQGWALDGNTGLDTTAYIGTRDSVDVVLKSNGANNPQPQLKLKASGGVEVNGNISLNGQIKIPQLGAQNQSGGLLALAANGSVTMAQNVDLFNLLNNLLDCDLSDPLITPATWKYEIQKITTTCGNVGIGTSSPLQRLHVTDGHGLFDNNLLVKDGNLGIGTSEPNTKLEVNIQGNYTKALQLNNSGNSLFFVPKNGGFGYNNLSQEGDISMFWSDGLDAGGKNQNAGFVLGPFKNSPLGIRIDKNGNIGIGTSNPSGKLEIQNGGIKLTNYSLNGTWTNSHWKPSIQFSLGTCLAAYNSTDNSNYLGIGITNGGWYFIKSDEGLESGSSNYCTPFHVGEDGITYAKEFKVQPTDWCDYVFASNYKLRPLDELSKFIKENHHLPEVPSETKAVSEGIMLGEMNKILLKKVEELTLYIIELNKSNSELKGRLDKLEKAEK